ncbi:MULTISPECIES: DUF6064 family protein [Thalassospira]|uniref:MFS transporter permease n=1 Tax=Thalassospira profundimaris TaxID=502049 RepID=A0A367V765_9PROT|nr:MULTISPECIES: DUF6064 family protein [Thalassospira]KZB73372.1 hypothetical protein AUQ43_18105 [Thalassospira sp. MCCC 1A01148]MBR9902252.1 hypothetical protein [Rhodospirillales bacterium]RCK20212.1 hypothetical protein TH6_17190 [Thalassospira profundimaris]
MSEWWDYGLADLLLFSPRVYYRLFEIMNTTWWLVVVSALVAGVIASGLALRHGFRGNRVILVLLALVWAWCGYGFLWQYYRPINWAIPYLLPGFALQVVLFAIFAARPLPLRFGWRGDFSSYVGLTLVAFALIAFPFVGLIEGRDLLQAELFGSAADPTALGTLGFVLLSRGTWRWALLPVPLLWCVISAGTLWVMDQQVAFVMLVAVWVTVFCGWLDLKNGVTTKRLTEAEIKDPAS